MPGLGHKSYMQIGPKEGTYGTFQLPTKKLEVVSWNVSPQIGVIRDPSLYGSPSMRALFQGALTYKGTFVVRLNYEGLLELLRAVYGTYSSSVVGGETYVRDHLYKEASTLNSYTIEIVIGDVPTGKCYRVTGAKLLNLTVRGTAGTGNDAMLMAEFTVMAKDVDAGTSNVTPATTVGPISALSVSASQLTRGSGSFTADGVVAGMAISCPNVPVGTVVVTPGTTILQMTVAGTNGSGLTASFSTCQFSSLYPVLFHQGITMDDGSGDAAASVRIRSFEVTLEQPHAERAYVGSLTVDEPLREDFLKATWRFTQEFTTTTQLAAARAFTVGSPQLVFQHPTTIGSAVKREFELRSNQANLVEFTDPVEGYGVLISTATWESWFDPTDASALVARIRNSEPQLP